MTIIDLLLLAVYAIALIVAMMWLKNAREHERFDPTMMALLTVAYILIILRGTGQH